MSDSLSHTHADNFKKTKFTTTTKHISISPLPPLSPAPILTHTTITYQHHQQLAITFHGGMESITYEWGAYNHHGGGHDVSPDDTAQTQIASGGFELICDIYIYMYVI